MSATEIIIVHTCIIILIRFYLNIIKLKTKTLILTLLLYADKELL